MKILQVHNFYQIPGGEDIVFNAERELLQANGHIVETFTQHNNEIKGLLGKLKAILSTIYNFKIQKEFKKKLLEFQPDIIHIHNTFPLISPSILIVAHQLKIPVVASVHNYRHICPNALLLRNNKICEDCINKKFAWPAILHRCYKKSFLGSLSLAFSNYLHHHKLKTWQKYCSKLIFLTEFSKQKFLESKIKFKAEQIAIKPNFCPDNGYSLEKKDYYLFVGRLSIEKGIDTLLNQDLWKSNQLIICGDGPLKEMVENFCKKNQNVIYKGWLNSIQIKKLLLKAKALIFSSTWNEPFGLSAIESLSYGTPVIYQNHIALSRSLGGQSQKLCYHSLDELKNCINFLSYLSKEEEKALNTSARAIYENEYSEAKNYSQLIAIYKNVIQA